ncbi:MSS4 factor, partial [Rhagologus leucostigma]|nr:MSS4 factor [Rhagologus leucostigma]
MEPAAPPPSPPPPPPPAAAPGSAGLVCAQGRNLRAVLCQRCGSRVLLPGAATFARREVPRGSGGNVKFLVCADCEAGPIGWHCLDDKDSFYVALERVAHE